jgi:hypothetical protein
MAHFAELNKSNNNVLRVIVVDNSNILDEHGHESEIVGIAFCKSIFGEDTKWLQCSYNSSFRLNYPGTGYHYNEELDIFLPPKPYNSWILDSEKGEWTAPIPRPEDIIGYANIWEDETQEWRSEQLPTPIIP